MSLKRQELLTHLDYLSSAPVPTVQSCIFVSRLICTVCVMFYGVCDPEIDMYSVCHVPCCLCSRDLYVQCVSCSMLFVFPRLICTVCVMFRVICVYEIAVFADLSSFV